jgi:hypothetical protein
MIFISQARRKNKKSRSRGSQNWLFKLMYGKPNLLNLGVSFVIQVQDNRNFHLTGKFGLRLPFSGD